LGHRILQRSWRLESARYDVLPGHVLGLINRKE